LRPQKPLSSPSYISRFSSDDTKSHRFGAILGRLAAPALGGLLCLSAISQESKAGAADLCAIALSRILPLFQWKYRENGSKTTKDELLFG